MDSADKAANKYERFNFGGFSLFSLNNFSAKS